MSILSKNIFDSAKVYFLSFILFISSENFSQVIQNHFQDSIVAKVGNIKITVNEFINCYEYGPAFYKKVKDSKKVFLNHLINEKLLALDGYSRGLDTLSEVKNIFNEFESDIATEELFKDEILKKISYTKEEIDTVAKQKLIEVELQWIYSSSEDEIRKIYDSLFAGIDFQKLFNKQLNDSIYYEDRYLKSSRYVLGLKNYELAKIIDTIKVNTFSKPIKANDGWYIVKLMNINYPLIVNESEQNKIMKEAETALIKRKMDQLSDVYVNSLMMKSNPVIKRKAFQVLRSYLAQFELPKETYDKWRLSEILREALNSFNLINQKNINDITLVELNYGKISLSDFINWYRARDEYIKFDKRSFASYSRSLENIIWRMVRDKLLTEEARKKGYFERRVVKEQSKWWKDKIIYSTVKNELMNSILLEKKEVDDTNKNINDKSYTEFIEDELTKKIFRKINELKNKYAITINEDLLKSIKVSEENNVKALDLYVVKRGGLIPRTPFPTIDNYWARWQ
ncbi:MAG: peptidyl-prolyl cis-trans isomerase [Melioribacter sp.]|uniref:peptidylprolyl isomerase n=1 Tax=Rosettibacter primus TaxID=3111523 RepID=UPI00247E14B8|nr:peptidyl-prolyl cis-trans isomerase [Melioribacter sp.]